jgi:mRNA interferase RelE/StbE
MLYSIALETAARRDLAKLERAIDTRVSNAIDALEDEPRPSGCVKLAGQRQHYRVRVGTYRIVYRVDDNVHLVTVERVQHRREVYR